MKDIAIALSIGSPSSTTGLVKNTFNSIKKNIGSCDWKVFICLGKNIPDEVNIFVKNYVKEFSKNFQIIIEDEISWATFANEVIELSQDYQYFIMSHDDIELVTPNFYSRVKSSLEKINKPVGWVSFTDIGWKYGDHSPPVRPGYHIDYRKEDVWNRKKSFQFHLFPDRWWMNNIFINLCYRLLNKLYSIFGLGMLPYPKPIEKIKSYKLDLPTGPVKCHAPLSHFVLIENSVLKKIGRAVDWGTKNHLLLDEDWGLSALKLNYPNIWIPDIEYYHVRLPYAGGGTRSSPEIAKEIKRVNQLFYEKWGFHQAPSDEELKFIREKHKDNLIPWSSYRNSYDWDYDI